MNRELKFRVWDNVDYMSSPFTLRDIQERKIGFTDECVVMQFTGLTDKNGKEIYEGDILQDVDKNRFEVIFYYGQFKAAAFPRKIRLYNIITPLSEPVFEVIGNIHQNPELLKLDL